MHGMPLAFAVFRRFFDGGGKIGTSGAPDAVGAAYGEEAAPEYRIEVAEPGWYYLVVQATTGGDDTEIELISPTAEAINTLGRWLAPDFVQCKSITPDSSGTADPSYTNMTRTWDPFERVAIGWVIRTTIANEAVRFRVESGLATSQTAFEAYMLRLHDWDQPAVQNPNCARFYEEVVVGTGLTATILPHQTNKYIYSDAWRWRVVVTSVVSGQRLVWNFSESNAAPEIQCLAEYSYDVVVRIVTSPGETATGATTLKIKAQSSGVIQTETLTWNTTEAVYTFPIAPRTTGDAINELSVEGFAAGDKFDIEVALNVTS